MTPQHTPTVSVIMPALNMAPWIRESIDSVLAQTFPDWELLVIDDGSTDDGPTIVEAYAGRDPRIRALRHPDGGSHGASASRNLGLHHARGEFIALLDADDLWVPDKLEEQLAIMAAHPDVGVIYGRTLWWYSWRAEANGPARDVLPTLGLRGGQVLPGHILLERFIRNAAEMPSTCSVLMRRTAIDAAGGFEDEFRYIYTDQVFFAKLFLGTHALPIDRCWDSYRRRADSSSALTGADLREARLLYLAWLAGYIEERGLQRLPVARTVRREVRWTRSPPAVQRVRRFINRLPGRIQRLRDRLLRRSS